jgi:hypothetical protein
VVALADGELSISSRPWGEFSLNGQVIGPTPVLAIKVPPGVHRIRIERPGFRVFTREIRILPGTPLRLADVVLDPEVP